MMLKFDQVLDGDALMALLKKHQSPIAKALANSVIHVFDENFSGVDDVMRLQIQGAFMQRRFEYLSNDSLDNVVDDLQKTGFHVSRTNRVRHGQLPADNILFFCSASSGADLITRHGFMRMPEHDGINFNAMRNFYTTYRLGICVLKNRQASFHQAASIFRAERLGDVVDLWQSSYELAQISTGTADERIYSADFEPTIEYHLPRLRMHFVFPETVTWAPERFDQFFNLLNPVVPEDTRRFFSAGGLAATGHGDPALAMQAKAMGAFDPHTLKQTIAELSQPALLAERLKHIAVHHPANLAMRPYPGANVDLYKNGRESLAANRLLSMRCDPGMYENLHNVAQNAWFMILVDRMAEALVRMAPKACAEAQLDLAVIARLRNTRHVDPYVYRKERRGAQHAAYN